MEEPGSHTGVGEITRGLTIWQKPWPPYAAGTRGRGNMTGARTPCSPSRRWVLREDAATGRESTIPCFLPFFHPLLSSQWPHIKHGQSSTDKRALETQPAFQRTGHRTHLRANGLNTGPVTLLPPCFTYTSFFMISKHLLLAIFPSFCPISEKEISFGFSTKVKTGMKSN